MADDEVAIDQEAVQWHASTRCCTVVQNKLPSSKHCGLTLEIRFNKLCCTYTQNSLWITPFLSQKCITREIQ